MVREVTVPITSALDSVTFPYNTEQEFHHKTVFSQNEENT